MTLPNNWRSPDYYGSAERECEVEIAVDHGEARTVRGVGIWDWLKAIGLNPTDRQNITHFKFLANHNGQKQVRIEPVKPKGKKLSQKTAKKLDRRMEAWLK